MQLSIESSQVKKFEKTLNALHRSAFPVSVRTALNSVAFHVKQESMPAQAKATFVNRRANFFKANSKVVKATGFNIRTMQSLAGFSPTGKANQAVEELKQQEFGGHIRGRSFITMKTARASKNWNKNVSPQNRLDQIKSRRIVNAARGKGSNKQNYVRAAFRAVSKNGSGAYVLGTKWKDDNQVLYRVEEIWGSTRRSGLRSSRKLTIKKVPLYTYRKHRKATIKKTGFMQTASLKSGKMMEDFFIKAAEAQIKKYAK